MFSVDHEHCLREYSKFRAYQTLLKVTHHYKPINKNKRDRFLTIIQTFYTASTANLTLVKSENRLAV